MPMHVNGTTWDLLVAENVLAEVAKQRGKDAIETVVPNKDVDEYLERGWTIKKKLKTKSYMVKSKPLGNSFEDELWTVFYKMGFHYFGRLYSHKQWQENRIRR